ncbi:MAG TPA: hypothetical protein VMV90_15010 [Rectinemataceae bacterium]|nr:hypothetical protein [Rectinemataceae bacterium]
MARERADLFWVIGAWLITIAVALLAFAFNEKRDVIDYLLIAALFLLSARQSYRLLRRKSKNTSSS